MVTQSNGKADHKNHSVHQGDTSKHGFQCPGRIPACVPDNLFGSPFQCPERIPTPRFSSPNSSLAPEELEQLQACIEKVNEFLRTIGNPRHPENLTALRLYLRKLRGLLVRVVINCGVETEELAGCLQDAGRDYLQLYTVGQKRIIPLQRVCSMHRCQEEAGMHEHLLENIPLSLRWELVLRFGEVVSQSPLLINIFFGLPLHLYLLSLIGCEVKVKLENEIQKLKGVLVASEEGYIQLQTANQQLKQINFDKICFLII